MVQGSLDSGGVGLEVDDGGDQVDQEVVNEVVAFWFGQPAARVGDPGDVRFGNQAERLCGDVRARWPKTPVSRAWANGDEDDLAVVEDAREQLSATPANSPVCIRDGEPTPLHLARALVTGDPERIFALRDERSRSPVQAAQLNVARLKPRGSERPPDRRSHAYAGTAYDLESVLGQVILAMTANGLYDLVELCD